MARWIDGDPATRARMMKQHERMINDAIIKGETTTKKEIARLSAKVDEMRNTLEWSKSSTLDKTLNRRIESCLKEIREYEAGFDRVGITYTPVE